MRTSPERRASVPGIRRSPKLTVALNRLSQPEIAIGRLLYPEKPDRPKTRNDCRDGCRPCPFVGCFWNMYLTVTGAGSIRFRFPLLEPWEVPPEKSCLFDIIEANPDGVSQYRIEEYFGATRQRAQQVEKMGLTAMRQNLESPHHSVSRIAVTSRPQIGEP